MATSLPNAPADAVQPDAAASPAQRVVAVDVGAVYTKAYVLQEVEGERRLVATGQTPTRADNGLLAVDDAVDRAVAQALSRAGDDVPARPGAAWAILQGHLTSVAGVPRVAIVAAREDDARAATMALESLPLHVHDPVILDAATDPERLLGHLEALAPDLIVFVSGRGGDQGRSGIESAVEAIARGFGGWVPHIVVAGPPAFLRAATALLGAARHDEVPGDPVSSAAALRDAVRAFIASQIGGQQVRSEQEAAPESSLDAICAATQLIAERYDVDVLTLDLGAAHAMAVSATGTGGQRRVVAAARADAGLRLGRLRLLRECGAAQLNRWLPTDVDEETLVADARRGPALPAALPETVEELLLDHAFAREALRLAIRDLGRTMGLGPNPALPPVDLLIGSGGALGHAPRLMQAALILLDAAQPDALTQLALDRATALALLGRIGRREGAAALGAAVERDGLLNLGLCIAPVGTGREGETAVKVEVAYASRSPVTVEVPFGAIEVVPLPLGDRASLKLWPSKEFDVGLGRGNAATPRSEVEGGAVGIIIDARGRPFSVPDTVEKRQAKLLQWLQATRAYPQLSFVQGPTTGDGA